MTIKHEQPHAGEFLLSEGNGQMSRETITVAAGAAIAPGQIMALVTATGEYAPYIRLAKDGTEKAACILYAPLAASESPRRGRAVVRLAEVSKAHLLGLDNTAEKLLAARFLIVR
jgi:hypothetical protein